MASGGSDQNVEYALSKLLQMGTVAEYESEFVVLANRVRQISESLLISFYISGLKLDLQCLLLRSNPKTLEEAFSLTRAAETRFTNLDIWEFLRSHPLTLGEDFFRARITEVRFETIAKDEKEQIVEKKIDIILPLEGEFASPKTERSLNDDEYIGVDVVNNAIDDVTAWVAEGGRMVLCYVQGSGRRKRKKVLVAVAEGRRTTGVEDMTRIRIRIWDPGIKRIFQDNTLRTR